MRKFALSFVLALYASSAVAGMQKPVELNTIISSQQPYGEGTYSEFLIKAYDASLWTDAKNLSWDAPFALSLRYHTNFIGKDIAEHSIIEMNHVESLSAKEQNAYLQKLTALFPNVHPGDVITAIYQPLEAEKFYYNGNYIGHIDDEVLAHRFLSIWLSPKTSAPDLRHELLKGDVL